MRRWHRSAPYVRSALDNDDDNVDIDAAGIGDGDIDAGDDETNNRADVGDERRQRATTACAAVVACVDV